MSKKIQSNLSDLFSRMRRSRKQNELEQNGEVDSPSKKQRLSVDLPFAEPETPSCSVSDTNDVSHDQVRICYSVGIFYRSFSDLI